MKFFNWLGGIFLVAVIAAAITAPGDKQFENFINKQKGGDTMSCKPIINKRTEVKIIFRLFSIQYVSYCELNESPVKSFPLKIAGKTVADTSKTARIKYTVPKITSSETYLGLFGRFWKT